MAARKISWKSLEHHAGAAVKVPEWVESLTVSGDRWKYCAELEGAFVQEGQSCSATAPTIGLLFDGLHSVEAKQPEWLLRVVANIAGNDQLSAWLRRPDAIVKDVGLALFERRGELFDALKHDSVAVRSAAAYVLAVAPASLMAEAIQHLNERLSADSSEYVLASCLLALARLAPKEIDEVLARFSTHESGLVRGATAVARLRVNSQLDLEPLLPGLSDWLGANTTPATAPPEFWWWSRSPRFSQMQGFFHAVLQNAVLLVEMAKHSDRVEAWTAAILELPKYTQAGWAYRGATDFLAVASGLVMRKKNEAAKPSELPASQLELARRLAESPLFATAGYGLPASGPVRRRWLGLEPPHLMETLAEFDGRQEPLYWIWDKRTDNSPVIQIESLVGVARWQFYVSEMTGEYSEDWYGPNGTVAETIIADAAADSAIKKIGPAVLNELMGRLVECQRQQLNVKYTGNSAAVFLLPLLRAGCAWDNGWEPLLAVDGEPGSLMHELVAALPVQQREAWLWANPQKLKTELNYVDLLPSARLPKRTLLKLAQYRREGTKLTPASLELERKIHEFAATKPHFAEAVKEARAEGYEG